MDYNQSRSQEALAHVPQLPMFAQEEFSQRYLGYNHGAKKQLTAKRHASNTLPNPFRYAGNWLCELRGCQRCCIKSGGEGGQNQAHIFRTHMLKIPRCITPFLTVSPTMSPKYCQEKSRSPRNGEIQMAPDHTTGLKSPQLGPQLRLGTIFHSLY